MNYFYIDIKIDFNSLIYINVLGFQYMLVIVNVYCMALNKDK